MGPGDSVNPGLLAPGAEEVAWINGQTRLYGIIGDPISQVRSPEMVTAQLLARGRNAILVPLHVAPEQFDETLAGLMALRNFDGFVVTIPYKARAFALADRLGPQAARVGALNALARSAAGDWIGEMFDGLGCVAGLERNGVVLKGSRIQLLGAGGAGAAIAVALSDHAPALLRIHDPDTSKSGALAERLRRSAKVDGAPGLQIETGPPRLDDVDLLLNATPVGMLDDARLPIAVDRLAPNLTVFDAIVKPETTPLLALARARGCRTVAGREMMRGQVGKLAEFFVAPDSVF